MKPHLLVVLVLLIVHVINIECQHARQPPPAYVIQPAGYKMTQQSVTTKPKFNEKHFKNKIAKITDVKDLEKMGVAMMPAPAAIIGRGSLKETKNATAGKCDPKLVCIANPLTLEISENNQIAFPPCINIHRCDGCCATNEKCTPTKEEKVTLGNVGIIQFDETQQQYLPKQILVANHTDCQCKCEYEHDADCKKINVNFIKDPYSCDCICPDNGVMCDAFHDFDKESCQCLCKKSQYARQKLLCTQKNREWDEVNCKCNTGTAKN